MGNDIVLQVLLGLSYLAVYIVWSRSYYTLVDPHIRRLVGAWLGVDVGWVLREGSLSGGPLDFKLPYDVWTWGIPDQQQKTRPRDIAVYILHLLLVNCLFGLWPFAIFLLLFLVFEVIHPLTALPLIFITIPIYSVYWTGRYELAGMRP